MWTYLLCALLALLAAWYWRTTSNYGWFAARGVVEVPSVFPVGAKQTFKLLMGKVSFVTFFDEIYDKYKQHKVVGYFLFGSKHLVVNDLELAKAIMIKDFDHFVDRRPVDLGQESQANRYLLHMLTNLKGDKWRKMRATLSPVFSSGKLRGMAPLLQKVGDDLISHLSGLADRQEEFNVRDVMTKFTMDSIATTGFGIEANSFTQSENTFTQMALQLRGTGKRSLLRVAQVVLLMTMPRLAHKLRISLIDEQATLFFADVIRRAMDNRKRNGKRRNDLIDVALDAIAESTRKDKSETDDPVEQFEKDAQLKEVQSDTELEMCLVSNALVLFFAGFETSSTIMAVCLWFLAAHPEVQERLFRELESGTEKDEDCYSSVMQESPLLDGVVHETLRLYPLTIVERVCVKDYRVPHTDFVIPKGMIVQIPSGCIMKDERYWSSPTQFEPGHFSASAKSARPACSFLAFGQGPRNCIGMRLALLLVKVAVARVVRHFRVEAGAKTPAALAVDPLSRQVMPVGGIWLKVTKR